MRLAREGIPFLLAGAALTVLLALVLGPAGGIPAGLVTLFMLYFFRDPERPVPKEPGLVVSPADGRVVEAFANKISIFLSVFDVHVNRVPCSGRVKAVRYRPGKFLMAFAPKASEENERNEVLLETPHGDLRFVQIAGWIARRIVCRLKEGDRVERGERFGLIRFGSRMEVTLPAGCSVTVARGDRVRGGVTPIARCV